MRPLSLCVVISLLTASASLAGGRSLRGQVMLLGAQDELTPAVGAVVVVSGRGDSDVADSNGQFRVFIDDSYREGETFTLSVNKKGWRIFHPLDGQFNVPANPSKQVLQVQLLPLGSKRFWSDERIEKLLRDQIAAAQHQNVLDGPSSKPRGEAKHISDWAARNGFREQEVWEEINKWAAEAEKHQDDQEKRGLAAFAREDFKRASELLTAGADEADARLAKELEKVEALKAQSIRRHRVAGDANYNSQTYDKALVQYQAALKLVDRSVASRQWAELTLRLGEAHLAISNHSRDSGNNENQRAAAALFRQLVKELPRAQFLDLWAHSRMHLAEVMLKQGLSPSEEASGPVWAEAVTASRAALEVYTRETFPTEWGKLQNCLANALSVQAETASRTEARRLLAEAVTLAESALQVFPDEPPHPYNWSVAQLTLGQVLYQQARDLPPQQASRARARAESATRAALNGWPRDQFPSEWAVAHHNLATVLEAQSEGASAEVAARVCAEAERSFRLVLEVRTRQNEPFNWSMTLSGLADSLRCQSKSPPTQRSFLLLEEAARALRAALEVRTSERFPHAWARTQLKLASLLSYRALQLARVERRDEGLKSSIEAVALCRQVVAQTRQESPRTWALAQEILSHALLSQIGNTRLDEISTLRQETLEAARAADGFIDDDGRSSQATAYALSFFKQLDDFMGQKDGGSCGEPGPRG